EVFGSIARRSQPLGRKCCNVAVSLKSSTRAPQGTNGAARTARGSDWPFRVSCPGSGANSKARLRLVCRFMGPCAVVAMPDPAQAGESVAPNESPSRFAVNPQTRKNFQAQKFGRV